MGNRVSIKYKRSKHFTCEQCGEVEYIQAHHDIPGDDSSLLCLCANCHADKHPEVPRNLFFPNRIRIPLEIRFWEKVRKTDTCWLWTGYINKKGYGYSCIGGDKGGTIRVNRLAWLISHGDIPKDMCVLHTCDNRRCVNPDHLFLGTNYQNIRDMLAKGRGKANNPVLMQGENNVNSKLKNSAVLVIKKLLQEGVKSIDLANRFNVSKYTISHIKVGRNWQWLKINEGSEALERTI